MDSFSKVIELGEFKLNYPVRYAISDQTYFREISPRDYLDELFHSSADLVQWREPNLGGKEKRELISWGIELSEECDVPFLVSSEYEAFFEEGISGIHFGSRQNPHRNVDEFKREHPGFLIGRSAHSVEEALAAEAEGADYVTLSPIYEPFSKEAVHDLLGLTNLRNVAQTLTIPVFALGGMDLFRIEVVAATGAAGIAGTSWINREIAAERSQSH